jgi:hypothetical protein
MWATPSPISRSAARNCRRICRPRRTPAAFDCAIVDDAIENAIRQEYRALKTPGFLFFRAGAFLGDIQKIRDWDDYLARTAQLLSLAEA